jgi:hypothetical protein
MTRTKKYPNMTDFTKDAAALRAVFGEQVKCSLVGGLGRFTFDAETDPPTLDAYAAFLDLKP